jgi:hypothetical protein
MWGYVVICQIFIAFAGGTLVICEQISALAVTSHQYVAVVLAVEGMFSNVGGAIGATIAAAMWTGTFPENPLKYLPEATKRDYIKIYGDLETQLSYQIGSPMRTAIMSAYEESQPLMIIAAVCFLVPAFAAIAV